MGAGARAFSAFARPAFLHVFCTSLLGIPNCFLSFAIALSTIHRHRLAFYMCSILHFAWRGAQVICFRRAVKLMLFPAAASRPICTPPGSILNMCKSVTAAAAGASAGEKGDNINNGVGGIGKLSNAAAAAAPFTFLHRLVQPPFTNKKIAFLIIVGCILTSTALFASFYTFHRGFRRTIQFWRGMGPLIFKYKFLKFKSHTIDKCSAEEFEQRITAYRETTAPQIVDLILKMGGIYIKIGQVMSTIGQGLLPDQYVDALKPLQDGVPARDYGQISEIIEQSIGKKMEEIFHSFDEQPIGAASIAQAHKAVLRETNETVIVKIQYPEVRDLFEADLSNLEIATRLFAKENTEVAKALRKRHENELDFNLEANNLRECTKDMQRFGVEPSLVRIPRVRNETGICSNNVLVMEYLDGTPLSAAIEKEQNKVARALGKKDGDELKRALSKRMREHFENGGGAGSGGLQMLGSKKMKLMNVLGPAATHLLRSYATARDFVETTAIRLGKIGMKLRGRATASDGLIDDAYKLAQKKPKTNVNLGRALKTLVHVHGIQLLLSNSGYNADPHPGNVLLLPDGRLGLLDYGMVGKISASDRKNIAEVVLALERKDKAAAAKVYRENGYTASFRNGIDPIDDSVLHRFSTFHFDKIDLSPLKLDNGETIDMLEVLRSTRERAVPSWVEEGRRLSGLLMGVCAQAARPISLAKEWKSIAKKALEEEKAPRED